MKVKSNFVLIGYGSVQLFEIDQIICVRYCSPCLPQAMFACMYTLDQLILFPLLVYNAHQLLNCFFKTLILFL